MHKIFFDGRWLEIGDEEAYRSFISGFKEVEAAGGLVTNPSGEYLLIHRNGFWDLPKGHREDGEDIRDTAVREVIEETGVEDIVPEDLLCVTDHCYYRDGVWHLKHTWWYRMHCNTRCRPVPQTEEGISKAEWIDGSRLADCLKDTYPSITEVISKAKI